MACCFVIDHFAAHGTFKKCKTRIANRNQLAGEVLRYELHIMYGTDRRVRILLFEALPSHNDHLDAEAPLKKVNARSELHRIPFLFHLDST